MFVMKIGKKISRQYRKRRPLASARAHLLPGTASYTGPDIDKPGKIVLIRYNEKEMLRSDNVSPEKLQSLMADDMVNWVIVDGVHDSSIINGIGEFAKINPLIIEDVQNINSRPKTAVYDDSVFVIAKSMKWHQQDNEADFSQVSMVIRKNLVITFEESGKEIFHLIVNRITNNKGRIRKLGPSYLVYSLLDDIVDDYFVTLEQYGEILETLEDQTVLDPTPDKLTEIYSLRRQGLAIRRATWPMREAINTIIRDEAGMIAKDVIPYFRDLYDHSFQIIDTVETYRETLSGLLDTYLSSLSNRLNEVMKVLTMIATIFIPLSFIAGVYGMNFEWMPELKIWWAYPAVWAVMITIAVCLLIYFKKKKWL